ncbi:MAG: 3-oxo-tetronate kinase [Betaproteobacteria bacterium]
MGVLLGCIADDFTGATDLAGTLSKAGMSVLQVLGVPDKDFGVPPHVNAIVVALKTRSIDPNEAVLESLAALDWLRQLESYQYYFKYCSTFDSTDEGNIGPVADAMIDVLGLDWTVFNPAFPTNKRTVYMSHLFVGDQLLAESGMRHHPLNPMTDSNLVRVLSRQSQYSVGSITHLDMEGGISQIHHSLERQREQGIRHFILDSMRDEHLMLLGKAFADSKLITGGSGMAMGLPKNFLDYGMMSDVKQNRHDTFDGKSAVISGSCSEMTRAQVEHFKENHASFYVDPLQLVSSDHVISEIVAWADQNLSDDPILIYSSSDPERVAVIQRELGQAQASHLIENAMSLVARELITLGVDRLVVAGGETSGAVVKELGITALEIGDEIDPGVPWTFSINQPKIALALKSGNFGGVDFFSRAFSR